MTANGGAAAVDGETERAAVARAGLEHRLMGYLLATGNAGAEVPPGIFRDPLLAVAQLGAMDARRLGGPVSASDIAAAVAACDGDGAAVVEALRRAAAAVMPGDSTQTLIPEILKCEVKSGQASREAAPEPERARLPLLTVADIFAPLPAVRWLCQALDLAAGAPALVAGYGYSGKTLALQQFALAVSTGSPAWGQFPVRQGRVLHLDYEQGSYLTRLRYQRLARAAGVDPRELGDRLAVAPLPGWYIDGDAEDELSRLSEGFDLVIVDSFRAACPSTDENSSEARIPLDRLGRSSERTGALYVVVHHARKPARDAQGGARMSVRGSGALYDACGSVLVFGGEKGDPITVAHEKARITGRTHEDFRLLIEDVSIDGDPDAGVRVSYLDAPAEEAERSTVGRLEEIKGRVLALIREEGSVEGGVNVLRSRLDARKEDVSAAVAELVRTGILARGGTYRQPTLTLAGTDKDAE